MYLPYYTTVGAILQTYAAHIGLYSERLDRRQDDDADYQHGRDLVEESVEALGVSVAVLFELATPLRHRADKAVVASGLGIVNSDARLTHIITLA